MNASCVPLTRRCQLCGGIGEISRLSRVFSLKPQNRSSPSSSTNGCSTSALSGESVGASDENDTPFATVRSTFLAAAAPLAGQIMISRGGVTDITLGDSEVGVLRCVPARLLDRVFRLVGR